VSLRGTGIGQARRLDLLPQPRVHPEVNRKLVDFGVEPVGSTPEQFAALLRSETALWHKLIRDLNITLE